MFGSTWITPTGDIAYFAITKTTCLILATACGVKASLFSAAVGVVIT
jgi:hypothetical protein